MADLIPVVTRCKAQIAEARIGLCNFTKFSSKDRARSVYSFLVSRGAMF